MRSIFSGIVWIVGAFVVSALVAALDGRIGVVFSSFALVVALVLIVRPRPAFGLGRRWVALSVALVSVLALVASLGIFKEQEKKQILSLRERDPAAYLVSIRGRMPDHTYLEELRILDPKGYVAELALREDERRAAERQAAEAREKEKSDLSKRLAGPLTLPDEQQLRLRLSEIDPDNAANAVRLAKVTDELRLIVAREEAERQRVQMEKRARSHPQEFLDLVDFNWHKGGFGVVMMASFKVRNRSPFDIKDIRFVCEHSAASGTKVDSNTQTVFDIVKKGSTKTFRKVNMGFVHTQARSSSCLITAAQAL